MIYKLQKPYEFEDMNITQIELDLDNAPADFMITVDRRLKKMNYQAVNKYEDNVYISTVISVLAKIPYEAVVKMYAVDYMKLRAMVSLFLASGEIVDINELMEQATDDYKAQT
jgi:hypothetical protein